MDICAIGKSFTSLAATVLFPEAGGPIKQILRADICATNSDSNHKKMQAKDPWGFKRGEDSPPLVPLRSSSPWSAASFSDELQRQPDAIQEGKQKPVIEHEEASDYEDAEFIAEEEIAEEIEIPERAEGETGVEAELAEIGT
jgi:hypothetical protein